MEEIYKVKSSSKNQITIPQRIREYLNLEAQDDIDFIINNEGEVCLRRGITFDYVISYSKGDYFMTKRRISSHCEEITKIIEDMCKYGKGIRPLTITVYFVYGRYGDLTGKEATCVQKFKEIFLHDFGFDLDTNLINVNFQYS